MQVVRGEVRGEVWGKTEGESVEAEAVQIQPFAAFILSSRNTEQQLTLSGALR